MTADDGALLVLSTRRAMAVTLLVWGILTSVLVLRLSTEPLSSLVARLAILVVVYALGGWLLGRRRSRVAWRRAYRSPGPAVDLRRSVVAGALQGTLTAVAVLAVLVLVHVAWGRDTTFPGVAAAFLVGNGISKALGAHDLRRWQDGAGRVLLRPTTSRRPFWRGGASDIGLVSVRTH